MSKLERWFPIVATFLIAVDLSIFVLGIVEDANIRATYISAIVGFSGVIITLLSQSLIEEYKEHQRSEKVKNRVHQLILGNCRQLRDVLPKLLEELRSGNGISIPRDQTRFILDTIQNNMIDLIDDEMVGAYIELAHYQDNVGFMILSSPTLQNKRAVQIHENFFIILPQALPQAESAFGHLLRVASQLEGIAKEMNNAEEPSSGG